MAPIYRAGLGPTFLEKRMLSNRFSPISVASDIVAVTDGDAAAAPVTNCYWIRQVTLGGTSAVFQVGPEDQAGSPITPKNYEWLIISAHRVEGAFETGTVENISEFVMDAGNDTRVRVERLSTTTFRYQIARQGGATETGATRNLSTNYGLRVEFNGTNMTLAVDDSLDITLSCTDYPLNWGHDGTNIPASWKMYWCGLVWRGSDDLADRPNTSPTIEGLNPDGDNESANFGDQGDCTDARGDWNDWDDDGADDSDTTIYLCAIGGSAGEETSTLDNVSMSTPRLVQMRYLGQAQTNAKAGGSFARIMDGDGTPNVVEKALNNMSISGVWRGLGRPFVLDPDGGPWSQAEVNDLRAGIRKPDTNTTNIFFAMMRAEVFDLGDDPPTVGGDRRRAAGFV